MGPRCARGGEKVVKGFVGWDEGCVGWSSFESSCPFGSCGTSDRVQPARRTARSAEPAATPRHEHAQQTLACHSTQETRADTPRTTSTTQAQSAVLRSTGHGVGLGSRHRPPGGSGVKLGSAGCFNSGSTGHDLGLRQGLGRPAAPAQNQA
eukprot:364555-Chlamydomonas_euryale.AAC.7